MLLFMDYNKKKSNERIEHHLLDDDALRFNDSTANGIITSFQPNEEREIEFKLVFMLVSKVCVFVIAFDLSTVKCYIDCKSGFSVFICCPSFISVQMMAS